MENWKDIFGTSAHQSLGAELRKAAFNRKAMLVNIPLDEASRQLNAYDKLAILLGIQAGTK
jgi:hypothetical protein